MFWRRQALIITAKTVGGPIDPEKIEEMDRELTKAIDDFNNAVGVEALQLAKNIGKPFIAPTW